MSDESQRAKDRAQRREDAAEGIRVWNPSLSSQTTLIREHARREWNFESFFIKVQRTIPYVSREEVREFIAAKGITLRNKPQPSGRVV